jgi:DNA-directed RNA polymerase specialized sigma24 family protein
VALLSLGEGLAASDVALVLETTEANVHTCLHLARKRIAKAIGVNYSRQD